MKQITDLDTLKVGDFVRCKSFYDEERGVWQEDDEVVCEIMEFGGVPEYWMDHSEVSEYDSSYFLWVKVIAGRGAKDEMWFTLRSKRNKGDVCVFWEDIMLIESESEKKNCLFELMLKGESVWQL